tara:strand:- start:26870 stop:27046 length:177 start_codon:yes stop_codon:yes gene_type:complete
MEKTCMNCERRTNDNKCAVKIVFAESFKISGGKYKRSTNIIDGSADNCTYFEALKKGT